MADGRQGGRAASRTIDQSEITDLQSALDNGASQKRLTGSHLDNHFTHLLARPETAKRLDRVIQRMHGVDDGTQVSLTE